ncbi:hypothetical protein pmac_cds_778 [Pandoravirus macleodensis]|uniref:F-box incomplete domain containing protein n=1 Tax=Pandoravirus macleodensis TaxID=2107707 RepID=A0A2U7UG70_9VIRU|nr:hypothetical protein pmac_cds_778 [Pandoravirus macleodensis]AVK77466.1 hypothetical protein pmac_cds_778 [Pandoravirus macleodensis]
MSVKQKRQDGQPGTSQDVPASAGWHTLPAEVIDLVLNGGTSRGRRHLAPRWRFSAALVCTQWRRCIATPSPRDAEAILAEASCVVRQRLANAWTSGKLACASALSDGLALCDVSLEETLQWLRRARASDAVAHAVLVASRVQLAATHARLRFPIGEAHCRESWPWLAHTTPITGSDDPRLDCDDYYACQARPYDQQPRPRASWVDILRVACRSGATDAVEALLGEPHRRALTEGEFALCARDASMHDRHEVIRLLCRRTCDAVRVRFNSNRELVLCKMAATHSAMRSLEIIKSFDFTVMHPHDCWRWLDVAAAADAVGVLEWFRKRSGDFVPNDFACAGLMAAAVMAGALSALDWLVAHFGMPTLAVLVKCLARFACQATMPRQQVDGIQWLVGRRSADEIVPLVYDALWPAQRRRLAAALLHHWPSAAPPSLWRGVPAMLALALCEGRWKLVDQLVAAADHALCHGAAGRVCDLWQLGTEKLVDVIKGGITHDRLSGLCSALAVLCTLVHRARAAPGATWPLCVETVAHTPPPLGDVDPDAWGRWCRIHTFDTLSACARARLAHMALQGHCAANDALALIAYLDAHT